MNKPTKLLLGLATLWPLGYAVFLFGSLFLHFTSMLLGVPQRNIFLELADSMFFVHLGTMLWSVSLTVFYVVHVVKNTALKNDMKAVWAAAVAIGSVFVMPVYWYVFIWRNKKQPSV